MSQSAPSIFNNAIYDYRARTFSSVAMALGTRLLEAPIKSTQPWSLSA
jgi:hypothetical protein